MREMQELCIRVQHWFDTEVVAPPPFTLWLWDAYHFGFRDGEASVKEPVRDFRDAWIDQEIGG